MKVELYIRRWCLEIYDVEVKCDIAFNTGPEIQFDSQVESKSGCLDFGDLPEGSAKSLPLKLLNRTHATVPIRLVISAVSQHKTFLDILRDLTKVYIDP